MGFGREEDIDGLFDERLISRRWRSNFDDVELTALRRSNGEAEEGRVSGVALHAELDKGGRVALDGLAHFALDRVELHGADNAVLLGGDADQEKPEIKFVTSLQVFLDFKSFNFNICHLSTSNYFRSANILRKPYSMFTQFRTTLNH